MSPFAEPLCGTSRCTGQQSVHLAQKRLKAAGCAHLQEPSRSIVRADKGVRRTTPSIRKGAGWRSPPHLEPIRPFQDIEHLVVPMVHVQRGRRGPRVHDLEHSGLAVRVIRGRFEPDPHGEVLALTRAEDVRIGVCAAPVCHTTTPKVSTFRGGHRSCCVADKRGARLPRIRLKKATMRESSSRARCVCDLTVCLGVRHPTI